MQRRRPKPIRVPSPALSRCKLSRFTLLLLLLLRFQFFLLQGSRSHFGSLSRSCVRVQTVGSERKKANGRRARSSFGDRNAIISFLHRPCHNKLFYDFFPLRSAIPLDRWRFRLEALDRGYFRIWNRTASNKFGAPRPWRKRLAKQFFSQRNTQRPTRDKRIPQA